MDGYLVPSGRRLRDLDVGEFLSFVYARTVEGMDKAQRAAFDTSLLPMRSRKVSPTIGKPMPSWASRALSGARQRQGQTGAGNAPPAVPPRTTPRPR